MQIPCESERFKGFFKLPWTDDIVISRTGVVINTITGNTLKSWIGNHGYPLIGVECNGKRDHFLIHRLLASAFISVPEELKLFRKLQVNHKDGVKTNNDLSNLEWIRQQQNMQHAFKNKLIDVGIPVLSKDVRTGEIVSYVNMSELARLLNIKSTMLSRHLKSIYAGKQSIEWKVFKFDDDTPWPEIPKDWKQPTTFNVNAAVVVYDKELDLTIISKSVKNFCRIYKLDPTHVKSLSRNWLKRGLDTFYYGENNRWSFLRVADIASITADVILDFKLRGTIKDKTKFLVTNPDKSTFEVIGILELALKLGYNDAYVSGIFNKNKHELCFNIAEYQIKILS